MIPMVGNNFSTPLSLTRENDHIWAIKIKAYLKGLSLWEVIENDADADLAKYSIKSNTNTTKNV